MVHKLFGPDRPNQQIIAWSLYDFANTAFSALFVSFFFPLLIRNFLGGTEFQIGLTFGLSLLLAAVLVPFLGALTDAMGKRLPLLILSTLLSIILTAATGYADLRLALGLGFLANLTYILIIDLYDSYIPDLAPPEAHGRLSGFGTAMGYLGTIVSLGVGYLVLSVLGFETRQGIQAMFPTTAILFLVFSLPMFLLVHDRVKVQRPLGAATRKAFAELSYTLTHLGQLRGLGPFLLASFIYNDAVHTTIIFLSLYGTREIGLSVQAFFGVFSIMAVAAVIGSLIAGKLSDNWGPKQTLLLILAVWSGVVVTLLLRSDWLTFLVAGSIGGAALGGVWTCNRHVITRLSPPHKIAEIFGIEGLTEKVSGVLGPIGFGFLATMVSYRAGLLYLLLLFLLGWYILRRYVPTIERPKSL